MEWVCHAPGCGERFRTAGGLGRHQLAHRVRARPPTARSTSARPAGAPRNPADGREEHGGGGGGGEHGSGADASERSDAPSSPPDADQGGSNDAPPSPAASAPVLPLAHRYTLPPDAVLEPAVARLAETVQRARLNLRQTNLLLAYLRALRPDDIAKLPHQGRTVMRQVERYGALALQRAACADGPAAHSLADFTERRYQDEDRASGKRVELVVYMRDLWSVLVQCFLEDPEVAPQLHFGAVQAKNAAGERVYSEMWTGDWWAEAEGTIACLADLLALVLHIDDTPQGQRSVCPIYATVGNLPMATRRLEAMMPVVAYLPRLDGTRGDKKRPWFRRSKRALLHKVLRDLLAPVEAVRLRGGADVVVGDRRRRVVPHLALVIADNEEKALLSLTFKKQSGSAPCHECLVPRHAHADTVATAARPFRSRRPDEMCAIVTMAASPERATAAEARRRAKRVSLWPLPNALWLPSRCFNVYRALPPDLLHDADLGVYRRLVLAIYASLERSMPAAADELDRRLHVLSAAAVPGLCKSFGEGGFRGLVRAEGAHYRALMQLLPLALRGLGAVPLEAVALVTEWPALYGVLRAPSVSAGELDRWQAAAAQWGARLHAWCASALRPRRGRSRPSDVGADGATYDDDGGSSGASDESDDSSSESDGANESDGDDGDDGGGGGEGEGAGAAGGAPGAPGPRKRQRRERDRRDDAGQALGFPKLHILLGGHQRDAIKRFGVPSGYNAGPFEARHVSAVKQAARRTSGAVKLIPQLARLARREELLDAVTRRAHVAGDPAAGSPPPAGADEPRLSWPAAETTTVRDLERRLRVRDLELMTTQFLEGEAPDELTSHAAAAAVARGAVQELHRLRTADGHWAYANKTIHGRARCDDVAIVGAGSATWYGRLVALARFALPSGRPLEAVLVRWYEAAPAREPAAPPLAATSTATVTTAEPERRAWAALKAACPRLTMVFNMSWCAPEAVLRREAVVPDWAVANSARDTTVGIGTVVFVNGFVHLVNGTAP